MKKLKLSSSLLVISIVLVFVLMSMSVYAVTCYDFDYTNQTACENNSDSLDCVWDSWGDWCDPQGCYQISDETACTDASCTWATGSAAGMMSSGWCEDALSCWNMNTQNECENNVTGCQWDSTYSYCEEIGCWNINNESSCAGAASCSWFNYSDSGGSSGSCGDTDCYSYTNESACNNESNCQWDSGWEECQEQSCSSFTDSTDCSAATSLSCTWMPGLSYCTESSSACSYYTDSGSCTSSDCTWGTNSYCTTVACGDYTSSDNCSTSGDCAWITGYCSGSDSICWYLSSNQTNCEDAGCTWEYSYDEGSQYCSYSGYCSMYNNEPDCNNENLPNAECEWNSNWNSCSEVYCSDLSTQLACDNTSDQMFDCNWSTSGSYCYEISCYDVSVDTTCNATAGCEWYDDNYCESDSCYDLTTQLACNDTSDALDCQWQNDYCYEQSCWLYSSQDLCEAGSCTWEASDSTGGNDGYCSEDGCWDYYTQTDCEAQDACLWESWYGYSYCTEQGCWNYGDSTECNGDSTCRWTDGSDWGWCEQGGCYNYDGTTESDCVNNSDGLNCTWQEGSGWCSTDTNCWGFTTSGTCTAEAECVWDSNYNYCYSGCYNYWNQTSCEADGCDWTTWNYCEEVYNNECTDISIESDCSGTGWCVWNSSASECYDPVDSGIYSSLADVFSNPACTRFNNLSTECGQIGGCIYDSTSGVCSGIDEIFCQNITNQTLCNGATFLSTCCSWTSGRCDVSYTDTCWTDLEDTPTGAAYCDDSEAFDNQALCEQIRGTPWYLPCDWNNQTGTCDSMYDDVSTIATQGECEGLGYTWLTQTYCSDGITISDSSCSASLDTTCTCSDTCWSCDDQTTCEGADLPCEWDTTNEYCDYPEELKDLGAMDCDVHCTACDYYSSAQQSCENSQAGCEWIDADTDYCADSGTEVCADACDACTDESDCENNGLGSAGSCRWDTVDGECEPFSASASSTEDCSDGVDNDGDGSEDCDDTDCEFASECGSVCTTGYETDCYTFTTSAACTSGGCTWVNTTWGEEYCGYNGSECYSFDNSSACGTSSNCQWDTSYTYCSLNYTKGDGCYNLVSQSECEADTLCRWESDSGAATGGWCYYYPYDCWWNTTRQENQTSCEAGGLCSWNYDLSEGIDYGWCDSRCYKTKSDGSAFYNSSATCDAVAECEWMGGECYSDSSATGIETSGYWCDLYSSQTDCEDNCCSWMNMVDDGMCRVVNQTRCDFFTTESGCNAETGICTWFTEGGYSWCAHNLSATCIAMDGNETGCDALENCTYILDEQICDPICEDYEDETNCDTHGMCEWTDAYCTDYTTGLYYGSGTSYTIESLLDDNCSETGIESEVDICEIGLSESDESLNIGLGVSSLTNAALCNGVDMGDFTGSGTNATKFKIYLDTDGNSTNGCNISHNSSLTGYEISVERDDSWEAGGLSQTAVAKRCSGGSWVSATITLSDWDTLQCLYAGALISSLDIDDLIAYSTLVNVSQPWRLYGVTANATGTLDATPADEIGSVYYSFGSVDSREEDCDSITDDDGDGYGACQDLDCESVIRFGDTAAGEDCYDLVDNDYDGFVDCDDADCSYLSDCASATECGSYNSSDITTPTRSDVNKYKYFNWSLITFDTSECTNSTIRFYETDSSCTTLNTTVSSEALRDTTTNNYTVAHQIKLHNETLGFYLTNGTTYYYKVKVCDASSNCLTTACTNVTTCNGITSTACPDLTSIVDISGSSDNGTVTVTVDGTDISNTTCGDGVGALIDSETESTIQLTVTASNGSTLCDVTLIGVDAGADIVTDAVIYYDIDDSGYEACGIEDDAWETMCDTNPDIINISIPGNETELWHCNYNATTGVTTNCTNMTSSVLSYAATSDGLTTYELDGAICGELFSVLQGRGDDGDGDDSSTSTSGGGGGGAGSSSLLTGSSFFSLSSLGQDAALSTSSYLRFDYGSEEHRITVNSVSNTQVEFMVASETQYVTLMEGETAYFDLDGDSDVDISIELTEIRSFKAYFTVALSDGSVEEAEEEEEVGLVEEEEPVVELYDEPEAEAEVAVEVAEESTEEQETILPSEVEEGSSLAMIVGIILLVLVIAGIVYFVHYKKKYFN